AHGACEPLGPLPSQRSWRDQLVRIRAGDRGRRRSPESHADHECRISDGCQETGLHGARHREVRTDLWPKPSGVARNVARLPGRGRLSVADRRQEDELRRAGNKLRIAMVAVSRGCDAFERRMTIRWWVCLGLVVAAAEALAEGFAVPPAIHRPSAATKSENVSALV